MKQTFEDLIKKIRTKEELIFFLEEIAQKKIDERAPELEKKLQSLPEIKLEIAFSPGDDFLNKISQWLEKELGQKIILDITCNPKIVAGAIIEYRGNFRNFSLAKEIDKLISQRISSDGRF